MPEQLKKIKRIPLTQNKFSLVSLGDYKLISQLKWYYRKSGKTNGKNGYAEGRRNGRVIFMHNLIMNPGPGLQVDHINRNGLDNRRKNLRIGTRSQSMANFPKKDGTKVKYRGVSFLKRKDGKQVYIGVFKTAKEAALAYNKFAIKNFGKFAQLNKIRK